MQQKADDLNLSAERYWQVLLHYQPVLNGVESVFDDEQFFLSPNGKGDPQRELLATISSFWKEEISGNYTLACRFVARRRWLAERLDWPFELSSLPQCEKYREYRDRVAANGVTLVFPSAHINSPASMFGHTLLRLDSAKTKSALRLYAVNYAAETDETNGFLFAIKGLTGFYPGYFSLMRYNQKIKEYSSSENRDIWEYRLDLKKEEVGRLFDHLWELDQIKADYYFFTENCSYQLLSLLEAGRPTLDLQSDYQWHAIPVDTIRQLDALNLITERNYRPSNVTQIHDLESRLNSRDLELVRALLDQEVEVESVAAASERLVEQRIDILDLAIEMTHYRFSRFEYDKSTFQSRYLKLLKARSRLGSSERTPIAPPGDPVKGHRSSRFAMGVGGKAEESYLFWQLRPAYHDQLDNPLGYQDGAAINFLDVELRLEQESEKFYISRITPLEISSFTSISAMIKPSSWQVSLNAETAGARGRALHPYLDGAVGVTLAPMSGHQIYTLGGLVWGERGLYWEGNSIGLEAIAGWKANLTSWWRFQLEWRKLILANAKQASGDQLKMGMQWDLSQNLAIRAEGEMRSTQLSSGELDKWQLSVRFHF